MINADSVKGRLKNIAIKENKTIQDCLRIYALERSIYRLSVSNYADHFVLKGGVFLYALFNKKFSRTTVDIDLLARRINNDSQKMVNVFREIFSIEDDDALRYDLNSLKVRKITEFKEYHGVNISVNTYLDRTLIPVSIDVGFGDVVYPDVTKMDFPVLLDMNVPQINAYSIYSVIAEKFEAIVSLGIATSRYKDFYNIYEIAAKFNLDGNILKKTIIETFLNRNTSLEDIAVFKEEFIENPLHIEQWNAFIRKKRALNDIDFSRIIALLMALLIPVTESIKEGTDFNRIWDAQKENWIDNPDTR